MNDKSIVIDNPVGVPSVGQTSKKLAHLVILAPEPSNKAMKKEFFLTTDKPDFTTAPGSILVRGFVCPENEETIKKSWTDLLANEPKENFEEVFFPMHRVLKVRSLVYRSK